MKNRNLQLAILLITTLIFNACGKKNRFEIDTTKNRIEVKIQRFDSSLISIDTTKKDYLSQLNKTFPLFLPIYSSDILNIELKDTLAVSNLFSKFLADSTFKSVNKKTMETFGNISDIEKKVSDAFTYIHYYFPQVRLPEVYFFVSGFNCSVLLNENFIGLGTDLYLGSDYPQYKNFTYKYLTNNMKRESVSADLVSATLFRMFPMNSDKDRLLDNMLFRGKIMYLESQFMPEEKPEILMGYSIEQWKWCKKNEKGIWAAIIDHKDLFSTNVQLIRKYMNEAPFTSPISQDSPGRLGTWLGWQIVENYMNNNKKVGIQDLMNENNYQKILEESGYRP
ncbi:MAG: hypothetical protein WCJ61_01150 [Paludibacter sp.]